jgi:hypothetical protein
MKNIIVCFLLILSLSINVSAQQDSIEELKRLNPYARERISEEKFYIPKDTIKLYLEDTLYYIKDNKLGTFKYFARLKLSFYRYGLEFELRDSLPDGFYCLYDLTKKQAKKISDKEKHLVASGEFRNRMKQGIFRFKTEYEDPRFPIFYKEIIFTNDTVNGIVREAENERAIFVGEYKMGVKDGFFFHENGGYPVIFLYENGEKVRETFFQTWLYNLKE